jgi:hypothetical protein
MNYIISKSIQSFEKMNENKKITTIDDIKIENELDLERIILKNYSAEYINENTKIHMKLKINLREFLILSYMLYPTLIK